MSVNNGACGGEPAAPTRWLLPGGEAGPRQPNTGNRLKAAKSKAGGKRENAKVGESAKGTEHEDTKDTKRAQRGHAEK